MVAEPFKIQLEVKPGTGPFKQALSLTYHAGVNVNRWPNGAGKSTLNWFLVRCFGGGKLKVGDLTINNEMTGVTAEIRFGAAKATLRQAGKKPKVEGEESLPPIEGLPEPIAVLADPQMKGSRPAFKARLKALLAWTGLEAVEAMVRKVLGDDSQVKGLYGSVATPGGDIIDTVDTVRAQIHEWRREKEEELTEAKGALARLDGRKTEILGDLAEAEVADLEPDVVSQQAAYDTARDALGTLRTTRKDRLEEQERRGATLAGLGERPDPAVAQAEARSAAEALGRLTAEREAARARASDAHAGLTALEARAQAAKGEVTTALGLLRQWLDGLVERVLNGGGEPRFGADLSADEGRVGELLARLRAGLSPEHGEGLREAQATATAAGDELGRLHREVGEADTRNAAAAERASVADRTAETWDGTKARLEAPIEVPTEEQIAKAEAILAVAQRQLAMHQTAGKFRELAGQIETQRDFVDAVADRVDALHKEADLIWTRLAEAVNEALASEWVRVKDEEIQAKREGAWVDFAAQTGDPDGISEGWRFHAAYELLLEHRNGERFIAVEKSTAVGPELLTLLGAKARAKGIILSLETASGSKQGEYPVDYYPPLESAGAPAQASLPMGG